MGNSESIATSPEITDAPCVVENNKQHEEHVAGSINGPKTQVIENDTISLTQDADEKEKNSSVVVVNISESDDDYSSDEEEIELDEFIEERKRILVDAKNLKQVAVDCLHPEKPVVATEPTAFARNYFERASAPTEYDDDDNFLTTISRVREGCVVRDMEEERKRILEEAAELKKVSDWYLHPEKQIVSDVISCGRNYFTRSSALEVDDDNDDVERNRILEEVAELKKVSDWYLHPEKQIVSDAISCGRNYFTRSSILEVDDDDDDEERKCILEEAAELKKVSDWYLHSEKRIVSDAISCGRNYFTRPSVLGDVDDDDDDEERKRILEDTAELKKVSDWYLHPEKQIVSDAISCGRNYFTRPSAATPELDDDECENVIEEAKELKKVANWYLHPEKQISSDASSCGRNYFTRLSASPELDENERVNVIEEATELKKVANWYLHPEKEIASDANARGRNYFTRPSAVPKGDEDEDERENVLGEVAALKKIGDWYLHPEKSIVSDSSARGRNYFTRHSGPEYDCEVELVLEETTELKKVAQWYLHPEKQIASDPNVYGRNYFARPSAPEFNAADSYEDEKEVKRVVEEMKELKTNADWYLHPEKKIEVHPSARGRNYFTRPSAFESNADADEEEVERVVEDMKELKTNANWYLHPEKKIEIDHSARGRNYFTRPSAPEYDDDDDDDDIEEERQRVLAEAASLKKVSDWYLHPEKKIEVDPSACGRNCFTRPSAPEFDDDDDDDMEEERERVLAEAASLKKVAKWYLHSEKEIETDPGVCGRNFFTRPSAPEYDDDDDTEQERERVLAEVSNLKKVADWYIHPEKEIEADSEACVRNYFTRHSSPKYEDDDDMEERELVLAETAKLKMVANWYNHPEKEIEPDSGAFGRNYFTRSSAPELDMEERERVLEESAELKESADWYLHPEKKIAVDSIAYGRNFFSRSSVLTKEEEKDTIVADALKFKKLAVDYLHPEKPVAPSSINCVRNYFDRPSAKGNHADYIHTQGHVNHSDGHMEEDYVMHHDDYHHYDYHHHDDISHGSFQSHGDHFDMDEDVFHGFRDSINAFRDSVTGVHDQHIPIIKEEEGDVKEGNLSRSPSSIMLFEEPAI